MAGGAWLVAFGDINGLRWVLEHERMAFSPGLGRRAARIQPGDARSLPQPNAGSLSQIVGLATVKSP